MKSDKRHSSCPSIFVPSTSNGWRLRCRARMLVMVSPIVLPIRLLFDRVEYRTDGGRGMKIANPHSLFETGESTDKKREHRNRREKRRRQDKTRQDKTRQDKTRQ